MKFSLKQQPGEILSKTGITNLKTVIIYAPLTPMTVYMPIFADPAFWIGDSQDDKKTEKAPLLFCNTSAFSLGLLLVVPTIALQLGSIVKLLPPRFKWGRY